MASERRRGLIAGALVVAFGGCGSDGGPPDAPPGARFVGTWQYQAGSMSTSDCNGSQSTFDLTGRMFTLQESTTADLEMPWDAQCAPIHFSIAGSTAAAIQESCSYYKGGSGCQAANVSASHYPFTLTLDAALMIEDQTSSTTTGVCGGTTTCTGTIVGTAVKL